MEGINNNWLSIDTSKTQSGFWGDVSQRENPYNCFRLWRPKFKQIIMLAAIYWERERDGL